MNIDVIKPKRIFAMLVVLWAIVSCSYRTTNSFTVTPTSQNGHSGGIKGVYAHEVFESCGEYIHSYGILRFYDDGTVLYASVCLDGDVADNWASIKQWFHRDSDNNDKVSRGKYFISQDQIRFSTILQSGSSGETATTDYWGTQSETKLILDRGSYSNDHKEKGIEFLKVEVDIE